MRSCRWLKRLATSFQKRLTVGIALCGYLLAVTGYPVPAARTAKDLSRPYPCQHHACGCASAEECWDHCCCYTPAEMLAWARENHVEPPAALVKKLQLDRSQLDDGRHEHASSDDHLAEERHEHKGRGACGCCSAKTHGAHTERCATVDTNHSSPCEECRQAVTDQHSGECRHCHAEKSCCPAEKSQCCPADEDAGFAIHFVIGSLARHCRGLADFWSASGAVPPPPPSVRWQFEWTVVERLSETSPLIPSRDLVPPDPPPRV